MRRIAAATPDSYDFHQRIVAAKQQPRRGRLEAASEVVAERIIELAHQGPFALHVSELGHSCAGSGCDPCLYADLRHLWDVPTQPLRELKAALVREWEGAGIVDCPYCGADPVEGFDHYLPKDSYPEFSVTANNLFQSCNRCNVLKGEVPPHDGERFLHPALDPLEHHLLRCSIDSAHEPPRMLFGIDVAAAENAGIREVADFHFHQLELGDRLPKVAAPELAAFLLELKYRGVSRGLLAAQTAESRARAHRETWGPNRWSTVLYAALADWLSTDPDP